MNCVLSFCGRLMLRLTADGTVFYRGCNDFGQLGLDETQISGVIEAANEAMGLQPIGGLVQQADALIAVIFG